MLSLSISDIITDREMWAYLDVPQIALAIETRCFGNDAFPIRQVYAGILRGDRDSIHDAAKFCSLPLQYCLTRSITRRVWRICVGATYLPLKYGLSRFTFIFNTSTETRGG